MNKPTGERARTTRTLNGTELAGARRQQALARLRELEVAVGSADEASTAWHVLQAARSGASLAEVVEAVKAGLALTGQAKGRRKKRK